MAAACLAYRMAAVLLCAAILGYAVARSRRYATGAWLLAAFTPSAWFLFGVVGTSGSRNRSCRTRSRRSRPPVSAGRRRWHRVARVTVPLAVCLLIRPAALIDVVVVALFLVPRLPTTRHRALRGDSLVGPLVVVGDRFVGVEQMDGTGRR